MLTLHRQIFHTVDEVGEGIAEGAGARGSPGAGGVEGLDFEGRGASAATCGDAAEGDEDAGGDSGPGGAGPLGAAVHGDGHASVEDPVGGGA